LFAIDAAPEFIIGLAVLYFCIIPLKDNWEKNRSKLVMGWCSQKSGGGKLEVSMPTQGR
jgi:hypothetical protein